MTERDRDDPGTLDVSCLPRPLTQENFRFFLPPSSSWMGRTFIAGIALLDLERLRELVKTPANEGVSGFAGYFPLGELDGG